MSYMDKFNREVVLDLDQATEMIVKSVMREGELRFREDLLSILENEVSSIEKNFYDSEEKLAWLDGLKYCIHLIKNIESD